MDITAWLGSIDLNPPTKRKRLVDQAQLPPSPPMSAATPRRPKRERTHRDDDDNADTGKSADFDTTPRANLPSSYASTSSRSSQSGASSPRKAMAALGIGNEARDYKLQSLPLSYEGIHAHRLPAPLTHLLKEIKAMQLGAVPVLDENFKTEIEQFTGRLPDSFYAPSADRAALGPFPALDDVKGVVDDAQRCSQYKNSEAAWNMKVHFPFLRTALFGQYARTTHLVDVEPCTTADIIHDYNRVRSGRKKKVDFVLAFDPTARTNEEASQERIEDLLGKLPEYSINHTDYEPLRYFPIAISIETKRPDGSEEEGSLQMGVWHAAQWNMLQIMAQDEDHPLEFLLGIIVVGHEWFIAATTREGNKTILWRDFPLGDTRDVTNTYRLIWALQRLVKWALDEYWPWYKKSILGML